MAILRYKINFQTLAPLIVTSGIFPLPVRTSHLFCKSLRLIISATGFGADDELKLLPPVPTSQCRCLHTVFIPSESRKTPFHTSHVQQNLHSHRLSQQGYIWRGAYWKGARATFDNCMDLRLSGLTVHTCTFFLFGAVVINNHRHRPQRAAPFPKGVDRHGILVASNFKSFTHLARRIN